MKKNCGKRDFLENSLHNRRFMSQARRRLLLAFRAECGMLRSPHLAAFIQRLLCRRFRDTFPPISMTYALGGLATVVALTVKEAARMR